MSGSGPDPIPARWARFPGLGRVCRAGLATRGRSRLTADDVCRAIDAGVNYLNWCGVGHDDGLVKAVRSLGRQRSDVFLAAQFFARTADAARAELNEILVTLATDYVDVLTFYYIESESEWQKLTAEGGALPVLKAAKSAGTVRAVGLTSHQRKLAARIVERGESDMVMIRYNAAHRGAESDVFPSTRRLAIPVVTYTALRWRKLLQGTPDDPPDFRPASAPDWYRFVLMNPDVTVGLMAPQTGAELRENLEVLDQWRGLREADLAKMRAHGDRVRRHGGGFP